MVTIKNYLSTSTFWDQLRKKRSMSDKNKTGTGQAEIFDAATVILVRESKNGQYEIFLMRRHRDQAFMGGAFVFPGGRLDEADCNPELISYTKDMNYSQARKKLQEPDLPDDKSLGLYFAALRETFEEAGVLLAYDKSGEIITLSDGKRSDSFSDYRIKLHENEISLIDFAEREDIIIALDYLTPYSHWITPEIESKRFDTRFFLALMPSGQTPIHDAIEMTESLWISPSQALKKQQNEEIILMPPTLKTIEELDNFDSAKELFSYAGSVNIYTILPQAFNTSDSFGVKLPNDPEYTIAEYKQPVNPGEPSRIVMKDGRWRTEAIG